MNLSNSRFDCSQVGKWLVKQIKLELSVSSPQKVITWQKIKSDKKCLGTHPNRMVLETFNNRTPRQRLLSLLVNPLGQGHLLSTLLAADGAKPQSPKQGPALW